MKSVDTTFLAAERQALQGDATAMASILRDQSRPLDDAERDVLADMIERLSELARGDIGGEIGRPEIAAGHWKVRRVLDRYSTLIAEGRQKTQAKAIVADEQDLSVRTVENYIALHRQGERDIVKASARYAIK